ncbi:hypothetical protein ACP4OV_011919 [Aristida adscensionis]
MPVSTVRAILTPPQLRRGSGPPRASGIASSKSRRSGSAWPDRRRQPSIGAMSDSGMHDALVMMAGGYAGNFFHAFSDGFLPAWMTVQHLRCRRRVVLAVLSYNPWWTGLFSGINGGLLDYHVIDLLNDKRSSSKGPTVLTTRYLYLHSSFS